MTTAEFLRKVKDICTKQDSCGECPLDNIYCNYTPESWSYMDIENMEDVIDNYEEEEEKDV